MKIKIKMDDKCKETSVIVITKEMNEEVSDILKKLSKEETKMIAGFLNDNVEILDPSNIYHIYPQSGKVYAETSKGEYLLHMCLLDNWSLALQSCIYFLIISCIMLPIAYVTNWMEHSFVGFITYFVMFIGIFITIWISQYFVWRAKIKKINKEIKAN